MVASNVSIRVNISHWRVYANFDGVLEGFDMNKVPNHEEFTYMFLLDRIAEIVADKNKDADEESKDFKTEDPITRYISSTKTSW